MENLEPHLPNDYSSAFSQKKSPERRLEKDPQLRKHHQESIEIDVEKGIVRILDELQNIKTDMQW